MRTQVDIKKETWIEFKKICKDNKKNIHGELEGLVLGYVMENRSIENSTARPTDDFDPLGKFNA